MTKKHRAVEWGKTILIVLLSCSALVLAVMASVGGTAGGAELWADVASLFGVGAGESAGESAARAQAAARPVQISLSAGAGRASAMYDDERLATAYERFGGALGQALEDAGGAQESTMSAVQAALSRPSVYFAYPCAVPLTALAEWLEAAYSGDAAASWFVLSVRDESVQLYFGDETRAFVCKTYLQSDKLERELESVRPDGTVFAFEQTEFAQLAPLTLLDPSGQYPVSQAEAASAWNESFASSVASQLGFNPYGDGYYTEPDGTVVFSEGGRTLRIGVDGSVALVDAAGGFKAADSTLVMQIEAARVQLGSLTEGRIGEASLYLTGVEAVDGTVMLSFDYYLDGIPICLSDGAAATVRFDGAAMTEFSVRVRAYSALPSVCALLPARQAQALAESSRLAIGYADTGDGSLAAGWMS